VKNSRLIKKEKTIMAESVYDRINDYGSVRIQLASPNNIRSWSFGEVKKPGMHLM